MHTNVYCFMPQPSGDGALHVFCITKKHILLMSRTVFNHPQENNIVYVLHPYKTVRLSATFGLRFIVLSYRTCQYQHLEGKLMPLAPLFTEICDIKH